MSFVIMHWHSSKCFAAEKYIVAVLIDLLSNSKDFAKLVNVMLKKSQRRRMYFVFERSKSLPLKLDRCVVVSSSSKIDPCVVLSHWKWKCLRETSFFCGSFVSYYEYVPLTSEQRHWDFHTNAVWMLKFSILFY